MSLRSEGTTCVSGDFPHSRKTECQGGLGGRKLRWRWFEHGVRVSRVLAQDAHFSNDHVMTVKWRTPVVDKVGLDLASTMTMAMPVSRFKDLSLRGHKAYYSNTHIIPWVIEGRALMYLQTTWRSTFVAFPQRRG